MKVLFIRDNEKIIGPNFWERSLLKELIKQGHEASEINVTNFRFLRNILAIRNTDVVHFYLPSPQTVFYLAVAKFFRKKTIFTLHGYYHKEASNRGLLKRILWIPLNNILLNGCDKATVPSQKLKNYLLKKGIGREIKVIPNGTVLRNEPYRKEVTKNLVFFTNFDHWKKCKGLKIAIKGFNLAKKKVRGIKLYVAGRGRFYEYFFNKYKSEDIVFLGYQKNPQKLMKKSDILLYISFLDNLPMILIEALGCCNLILTNNIGGTKEIMGQKLSRFVIKPNPLIIKNTIEKYYSMSLKEKKEVCGLLREQSKKFEIGRIAKEFIDQYDK